VNAVRCMCRICGYRELCRASLEHLVNECCEVRVYNMWAVTAVSCISRACWP